MLDGNSRAMKWGWFKKTFPHCQKPPVLNDELKYKVHPEEYEGKEEKLWVRHLKNIGKTEVGKEEKTSAEISSIKKTA